MNLHIPVPKQAHVTHAVDGFVSDHRSWQHVPHGLGEDLGEVTQDSRHLV